jgi:hypothetical protein
MGAAGSSWGIEALAATGAANRAQGEEIEEPILGAATMGAMDGIGVAVRAGLSVAEHWFFGRHGDFIGCNPSEIQLDEN